MLDFQIGLDSTTLDGWLTEWLDCHVSANERVEMMRMNE
jgi:hypothetical protein